MVLQPVHRARVIAKETPAMLVLDARKVLDARNRSLEMSHAAEKSSADPVFLMFAE
jgi:hypothetical protein